DGIRDRNVTGVQTCALPIFGAALAGSMLLALPRPRTASVLAGLAVWVLPPVSLQEGASTWPWPWSVPAMIGFALFLLVLTIAHRSEERRGGKACRELL